jgi:hypothetical protein
MPLDFSGIEGHQLHLQEPKDAVAITDGVEVFEVPRQFVASILKAVPELRYSFEHLGGQHHGVRETRFATVPWKSTKE